MQLVNTCIKNDIDMISGYWRSYYCHSIVIAENKGIEPPQNPIK